MKPARCTSVVWNGNERSGERGAWERGIVGSVIGGGDSVGVREREVCELRERRESCRWSWLSCVASWTGWGGSVVVTCRCSEGWEGAEAEGEEPGGWYWFAKLGLMDQDDITCESMERVRGSLALSFLL